MASRPAAEMDGVSWDEYTMSLFERVEASLDATRTLIQAGHWAEACFWSGTAAGQALETYLIYAGGERGPVESVGAMAQMCAEFQPSFSQVVRKGKYLDRYYATTRYPDALPYGAVPSKWFDKKDATEALEFAAEIVASTKSLLLQSISEKTR